MRVRRAAAALLLLLAGALAGCGDDATPAQAVPALREQLAKVDAAVVAGDPAEIRGAANGLGLLAREAGDAGKLSDDEVDRILSGVDRLIQAAEAGEPAEPEESEESEESVGIDPVDPFEPGKAEKPKQDKPDKLDKPAQSEKKDKKDDD